MKNVWPQLLWITTYDDEREGTRVPGDGDVPSPTAAGDRARRTYALERRTCRRSLL
jgi:hypothetical protein